MYALYTTRYVCYLYYTVMQKIMASMQRQVCDLFYITDAIYTTLV